jgi:SAM-dependent methyltransferase
VKVALESDLDAYGLDFNAKHICAGRIYFGLGQRLMEGTINELWRHISKEKQFDLITMFEVIEHVEEPAKLLREAHSYLRVGGILAVSCPNEARWQPTGRIFVDYPPHHLTRWRPDTMRMFLEHCGFKHIHTQIDSSFRDLFWVAYVNRSARKRLARKLSTPSNEQKTSFSEFHCSPTTRSIKMKLDSLLRMTSAPFDTMLKANRIGTMGMLIVARKI